MMMQGKFIMAMAALALIACGGATNTAPVESEAEEKMKINKVTPILLTHDVEAAIAFWAGFGMEAPMTAPGEDGIMFAIITNGDVELMYQTFKSAIADNAQAVEGVNRSVVYLEVASLDEILPVANKHDVVKPEHTTFYGAREIYIRDPAGNLVGFAEMQAADG